MNPKNNSTESKLYKMNGLKVITIDFWNTLYKNDNARERNAYRQRALVELLDQHAGRTVMGSELDEAVSATWKYFEKIWKDEQRTIGAEESVDFILDYLQAKQAMPHAEKLISAFADSVLVHPPSLMENVKDVLPDLSSHYNLAIISDTGFSPGSVLKSLMERDGIDHLFSSYSFSNETGVSKPNEKAYYHAIEPLGYKPNEGLHIGDIEHTDVKGAKSIGMYSIRFAGNLTDFTTFRHSSETEADHQVETWKEVAELLL
ncbi:MAG: HAD family hydrolase [Candidatus Kapaibacteriales bacterium]